MVESVYCAVRTDSLYKADYISSLKRLIQTKRRLGLLDLEGGGRKVLSSEGNDLPIDTASGFGKIASLENTVKVFRPYKTYLKRCKRSVSPTGRNCNTKLHFALLTPLSSKLYLLLKENFQHGFLFYKIFTSAYHSLFGLYS